MERSVCESLYAFVVHVLEVAVVDNEQAIRKRYKICRIDTVDAVIGSV